MDSFRALVDRFSAMSSSDIMSTLRNNFNFNERNQNFIARNVDQITQNLIDCKNACDNDKKISYNEDVLKLDNSLKAFAAILEGNERINLNDLKNLLGELISNSYQFLFDIENPTQFEVFFGENKKSKKIRQLSKTSQAIFWEAIKQYRSCPPNTRRADLLRRVAVMSLSGGVPVHFLDDPELKPFGFNSSHFESSKIPLNADLNFNLERSLEIIQRQFKIYSLYSNSLNPSETSLRMHFWDPIMTTLFLNEEYNENNDISSELHVKKILKLDDEKKIDYSIVSKKLGMPVFCLEAGLELMRAPWVHKDFSKLVGHLALSCARQVEKLESMGHDPFAARSFGALTGGTAIQLAVGHPVLVPQPDNDRDSFYVSVSCPREWFFDMVSPSETEGNDSANTQFETDSTAVIATPASAPIPDVNLNYCPTAEDLNVIKREPFKSEFEDPEVVINVKNLTVIADPGSGTSSASNSPRSESPATPPSRRRGRSQTPPRSQQRTTSPSTERPPEELNANSVKKLANFMKCIKEYIGALENQSPVRKRSGGGDEQKPLSFQNEAKIASSLESHEGQTPHGKKVALKNQAQLGSIPQINLPPVQSVGKYSEILVSVEKSISFEYDLYKGYLKNSPVFPVCFSADFISDKKTIKYLFERMSPLLKNECFVVQFSGEEMFGPMIRCSSVDELFMEAVTFACHVLYGVYILHEELGIVHSDISPSNIMFSSMFDCWKLNDFNHSMKFEESISCQRKAGTNNFVAPESKSSGIFTKASDIYSIGAVLFLTFNIKLMIMLECLEDDDHSQDTLNTIYNQFLSLTQELMNDKPEERPTAKTALTKFYNLLISLSLEDFQIYGSENILIKINNLIIISREQSDKDTIPMNPII